MGCLQVGRSYFDIKNVEEKDLRKWEKEVGSFSVDFNQVYQRLMVDLETLNPVMVKRVIESEFSQDFYKIFNQNDFFKIKSTDDAENFVYDFNKVVGLVFLMSAPGMMNNKFTYYIDKAYYLFLRAKANEEDDLSQALDKSDNLRKLVENLTEVACIGATNSFFAIKNLPEHGILKEINAKKSEISAFIIDDLFTIKNKQYESLSFKELKEKFTNDSYFFSSGYFREKALECIAKLNAQPTEEKK
jgi:hypothetical protein